MAGMGEITVPINFEITETSKAVLKALIAEMLLDDLKNGVENDVRAFVRSEIRTALADVATLSATIDTATRMQAAIEAKDAAYTERNLCVALIAAMCQTLGSAVGIKEHEGEDWEDGWRHVLFIDLPTGQVSWHLHDRELANFPLGTYDGVWDGHTTDEKYVRVKNFAADLRERYATYIRTAEEYADSQRAEKEPIDGQQ